VPTLPPQLSRDHESSGYPASDRFIANPFCSSNDCPQTVRSDAMQLSTMKVLLLATGDRSRLPLTCKSFSETKLTHSGRTCLGHPDGPSDRGYHALRRFWYAVAKTLAYFIYSSASPRTWIHLAFISCPPSIRCCQIKEQVPFAKEVKSILVWVTPAH
jgi:hypothetical protein